MSKKFEKPSFKIEKNVPLPLSGTKWLSRYPFKVMEIGDSMVVNLANAQLMRMAAAQYKKRSNGEFNYATRTFIGEVRLWRIKSE